MFRSLPKHYIYYLDHVLSFIVDQIEHYVKAHKSFLSNIFYFNQFDFQSTIFNTLKQLIVSFPKLFRKNPIMPESFL